MTVQQALNALETGELVRFRGYQVIVTGVGLVRAPRVHTNGYLYCIGAPYYSCRMLGKGASGGTEYWGNPEEIMSEAEYQSSLKKLKGETS